MYWCSYKTIHKHTTVCTYIFNEHFSMNPSHESHSALDKYSKMHYFVTEMHTHGHEHIFVTNRAFLDMGVIHCVICTRSLLRTSGWVFLYRLTMPHEVQILLNRTMDFLCITNISNMLLLMKNSAGQLNVLITDHQGYPRWSLSVYWIQLRGLVPTWGQFHRKCLRNPALLRVLKLLIYYFSRISQGQMS